MYQVMGLHHLRENGVIHRDLKPENIMLNADGYLTIVDFGLAKVFDLGTYSTMTDDASCGTPGYMAPEVYGTRDYSFEVDTWSLAIIMYQMAFGLLPWMGQNSEEIFINTVTTPLKLDFGVTVSSELTDLLVGVSFSTVYRSGC